MANNANNVSVSKPKVGGAVWWAPLGTTLPTSTADALDNAFVCLGYVSDDGIKVNHSRNVETLKAYGGDVVATPMTEKTDSYGFQLIEVLNEDVQKAVFGTANVSGTLSTGLTVKHNSNDVPAGCWVIDNVLNGKAHRDVIANGKVTEIGEITFKDDELVGYDVTVTAMAGSESFGYDSAKTFMKG